MKKWKAGYTVEASLIVPIVLWAFALAMRAGIILYEEVRKQQEQEAIANLWEVEEFYRYQVVGEVLDDQS